MIQLHYQLKDVYAFKEALKVAQEVTYSDLNIHQNEAIKNFTKNISPDKSFLELSPELKKDIIICLNIFKSSRTWHWLRDDFKKSINEFIYLLNCNI